MKRLFSNLLPLATIVLVIVGIVTSCSVEDLTKDLNLQVSGDFLVNPINIQVIDAADITKAPVGMTVTIEGRDKDKIYSVLGEKTIKPVEGTIALAVKKADAPTAAKPLEFTLVATAPNFITIKKSYILSEAATTGTDKVSMVNPSTPPAGVTAVQTTVASTTGTGTAAVVTVASPVNTTKKEQASIAIAAGTKMLASDGSEVTGSVQTQVVHFDNRTEASMNAFPGGLADPIVKKADGTVSTEGITPVGFFKMNMTAGSKEVKTFSKPLDATMDIDPNTYNEAKGRKIQAGDTLQVMSRDDDGTEWKIESNAIISNNNGKMQATFKQAHLSSWALVFPTGGNKTVTVTAASNVPSVSGGACTVPLNTYTYFLVNANNPILIYAAGTGNLNNNSVLGKIKVGATTQTRLIVLKSDFTQAIPPTAAQTLATNSVIDLRNLPAATAVAARFNVRASCVITLGQSTAETTYKPNMKIQFRDMANPNVNDWSNEFEVKNGVACVMGLEPGHSYDFSTPISDGSGKRIIYSKAFRQPNGLLIPVNGQNAVYRIYSPVYNIDQNVEFKKAADGTYEFNYNDRLPDNICTEISKLITTYVK